MEMRTRDVGSFGNEPLFGAWSSQRLGPPGAARVLRAGDPVSPPRYRRRRPAGGNGAPQRSRNRPDALAPAASLHPGPRCRGYGARGAGRWYRRPCDVGLLERDDHRAADSARAGGCMVCCRWRPLGRADGVARLGLALPMPFRLRHGDCDPRRCGRRVVASSGTDGEAMDAPRRCRRSGWLRPGGDRRVDPLAGQPRSGDPLESHRRPDSRRFRSRRQGVARSSSWTFLQEWRLPAFDKSIGVVPVGMLPGLSWAVLLVGVALTLRRSRGTSRRPFTPASRRCSKRGGRRADMGDGFLRHRRIRGELLAWIIDWLAPLAALTWAVGILGIVAGVVDGAEPGAGRGGASRRRSVAGDWRWLYHWAPLPTTSPRHAMRPTSTKLGARSSLSSPTMHGSRPAGSPCISSSRASHGRRGLCTLGWSMSGNAEAATSGTGQFALQMGTHRTESPPTSVAGERRTVMRTRLERRGDLRLLRVARW